MYCCIVGTARRMAAGLIFSITVAFSITLSGCGGSGADCAPALCPADAAANAPVADAGGTAAGMPAGGSFVPDAPAAQTPLESGAAAAGIRSVSFRGEPGTAVRAAVDAAGAGVDAAGGDAAAVVTARIDGAATDLYITMDVPDTAGAVNVDWDGALSGRFLTMAVLDAGGLELSIAGLRNTPADVVAACSDPAELEALLRDRLALSGDATLCTVSWDSADGRNASVVDARRRASALGEADPVSDVNVRAVDGEYEIGWPLRLCADYNQDGEVSAMDLTPVGILFGLKATTEGWIMAPCARADGNNDGAITVSDITPLGQNYGNRCFNYRVEKATGDADGPGETWETAGECGRSTVTRHNNPVTATSASPYQRMRDAAAPGWIYYRVVAIEGGGTEAAPSEAALAPDVTPPVWESDPELVQDVDAAEYEYWFRFNETGTDDRGQVEYRLQVMGNFSDPDLELLMTEYTNENSPLSIASPYKLDIILFPYQGEPYYNLHGYPAENTYNIRLVAVDAADNQVSSDWVSFQGQDLNYNVNHAFILDDWDLWINREGTIRFSPPSIISFPDIESLSLYTEIHPQEATAVGYSTYEDYDLDSGQPYTGDDLIMEHALEPGELMHLALRVNTAGREYAFLSGTRIFYPHIWFRPFEGEEHFNGLEANGPFFLVLLPIPGKTGL